MARILEWVAIPFSRGSSWPRDLTQVSYIASRFLYCLSHQEMVVWAFFGIALLWDWNENWPFPVLLATAELSKFCWHIECSSLTASSFRIWNNSAGIPSPLITLLTVMLPKAHFISHFRMSGSRWVTTPSWLYWLLRCFLYSSVYSCHLFLNPFCFC